MKSDQKQTLRDIHRSKHMVLRLKDEFAEFQSINAFVLHAMGVMLKDDLPLDRSIADGAQLCLELSQSKADEIAHLIHNLHKGTQFSKEKK